MSSFPPLRSVKSGCTFVKVLCSFVTVRCPSWHSQPSDCCFKLACSKVHSLWYICLWVLTSGWKYVWMHPEQLFQHKNFNEYVLEKVHVQPCEKEPSTQLWMDPCSMPALAWLQMRSRNGGGPDVFITHIQGSFGIELNSFIILHLWTST